MFNQRELRVLSIAHTAVSRETGRLRYHPFAQIPGLDVHLLAPQRWRQFGRDITADPAGDPGISLHLERILLSGLPGAQWYAHVYPRLHRIIRSLQPDVIHLWEEPWSFVALQAALWRGKAAIVLEVDQNILKRLPPPFESIRRYVLSRTDVILSRSDEATAVVRACGYRGNALPIGYGVDQKTFHPSLDKPAVRSGGGPLRMAYVGRLIPEKGLDDALTAMTLVPPAIELSIMGEGPHESRLRKRVQQLGLGERVMIRGWGSAKEVADFIRLSDVSILLTRTTGSVREQFGRAIVESQSCGIPVIGSECGAIPEVVGEGGWIIPEGDPTALANLLNRLHRAPEEIALRSAAGLVNVATRFTYETVAQGLEAAWRRADSIRRQSVAQRSRSTSLDLDFAGEPEIGKNIPSRNLSMLQENKSAPFHVVQAVQEFSADGGVENVALELSKAWDRAAVPNSVLASACTIDEGAGGRAHRVAPWLVRIPTRGAFRHLGRLIVVPIFTLAVTIALRKHSSAVVVSHGDSLAGDVLIVHAVNAASLNEKKQSGNWRWRLNPMHLWVGARDRFMIGGRRYRGFVAVSPRVATELQTYYNVPSQLISIIPNGIDLQKYRPDNTARQRIRRELGIPPDAPLLLFVGHEFERKGLAYLIEALKYLSDDVHLLIVGSDNPAPYRRLLPDKASRLFFLGPRNDLPALYSAADAFVLPTAYETFSLVCMEAMASGLPVFATRVGGIEDYLEDGVNGYGIERDAAKIAAKIRPVLHDSYLLSRLREGARATAERFDWDTVANQYTVLLREIWDSKTHVPLPVPAIGN